ncbi:MAG: tetratricopeptide repeat protein [Sedimentisphaerales bacterium]
MQLNLKQYLFLLLCTGLAIVTLAVYWPVHNHQFVNYDDNVYVTENQTIHSGPTWQNIKWAFTTGYASNWHPLTWLSHMVDCRLFGVSAPAHHIVNLLFHIANTLLLLIVLNRMTKQLWPSAFVAALFALHPLHVESVAWVAERKDVLSTLFWLLTMLAYARYAERPSVGRYFLTLVLFVLGLMSKPMLVTLPFVLLLLDYWPLGRLFNPRFSIIRLLLEKLPFIILSAASSIITFIVQQKGGAMAAIPFKERIANTAISYLTYIGKMFWPAHLAVLYPHPAGFISAAKAISYALTLILITAILLYYGRRYKYLAVGWLWYLGTLVPVIGIVQVGSQAMADRYAYVPLIGLFVIIAFTIAELAPKIPFRKIFLTVLAAAVLIACVIATSIQLKFWKNSFLLFEHTLAVIEGNSIMQNNSANVIIDQGKPENTAKLFSKAIKSIPNSPEIHNNFGNALRQLDRKDEAIEHFKFALEIDPNFSQARYNLGLTLADKGKYDEAIEQFNIYLGSDVNLARFQQDLKPLLVKEGSIDDTIIRRLKKTLASKPDLVGSISYLGYALAQSGKPDQAVEYYYLALQIEPNNILTHGRLALALAAVGRIDEAIEQCHVVIAARPDDAEMQNNLGMLLQRQDKIEEAIECYKKALQIDPKLQKARENLDSALAQKQAGK